MSTPEENLERVRVIRRQVAAVEAWLRVCDTSLLLMEKAAGLTCSEADALAVVLDEFGRDADAFILAHAHGDDDPDDEHYSLLHPDPEEDPWPDPDDRFAEDPRV